MRWSESMIRRGRCQVMANYYLQFASAGRQAAQVVFTFSNEPQITQRRGCAISVCAISVCVCMCVCGNQQMNVSIQKMCASFANIFLFIIRRAAQLNMLNEYEHFIKLAFETSFQSFNFYATYRFPFIPFQWCRFHSFRIPKPLFLLCGMVFSIQKQS